MPVADFPGVAQLGLRRRLPVRAVAQLRPARRPARAWSTPRTRSARRDPRRRLQPPRSRRRVPAAVQSGVLHRPAPTPWGRGDQPRRARLGRRAALHHRQRRATGCASTTSTACGWTRPTRSSTTARRTSSRELAAAVRARGALAGDRPRRGSPQPRDDRRGARRGRLGARRRLGRRLPSRRARCSPATRTATIATSRAPSTSSRAPCGRAGCSPASTRCTANGAARHRPVARPDAALRRLPAEPRSGRQPRAGDRLHHAIDAAAWRAASALLLTAPMTPLLFMGQEWAALTPFLYFTDLEPRARRLVTEGRRREFAGLSGVHRSRGARAHPRSAGACDVRGEPAALGGRERPRARAVLALYTDAARAAARQPALGASDETRRRARAAVDDDTLVDAARADGDDGSGSSRGSRAPGTCDRADAPSGSAPTDACLSDRRAHGSRSIRAADRRSTPTAGRSHRFARPAPSS